MKETAKKRGRPAMDESKKKLSFTVSLTIDRANQLIKEYGSLTKALDSVKTRKS